ncbi:MAG: flagellar basal body P-ring formation chaperone FlgA [Pseudomonadota bacterium]
MIRTLLFLLLLCPAAANAAMLVAARTVPAKTVLSPDDVRMAEGALPGVATAVEDVVGLETRVTLYPGRPVHAGDLTPAAMVERNDIVTLRYRRGSLMIETDGRALDRAAEGGGVRVMNMGSRAIVTGRVLAPGIVVVGR